MEELSMNERVFLFIRHYIKDKGIAPTRPEIMKAVGINNSNMQLDRELDKLVKLGLIRVQFNIPRGIELLSSTYCANNQALTTREQNILGLLARGWGNEQIANELAIAPDTVKNHLTSIFAKLGVNNRTQAVVYGLKKGWVNFE